MPQTSIISGGSRGLGLAVVERLLERGDRVATFSRSGSARLDGLAAAHPDRLLAERFDAADSAAVRGFVHRVVTAFGRIDHCIASAAVVREGVLATARDDEIDAMLTVNLAGAIVLVRESVRQMLTQADGGRGGTIVVISSIVASRGSPGLSVYAATKAGLEGFSRSLARELGPRGIRVNAVAPGFIETDLSAPLSADDRGRIARRTPLGRLGRAGDVVGAIDFLSGPRSGFITGQTLSIDGGSSA
ncbi:MAG: SDR family oxidoreductase [Planctomycetia bacterium]|nr:SDR family oxidoreductase [Planctomycetia bacterium]